MNKENLINIPGRLHSVALDSEGNKVPVSGADEIFDDKKGKFQKEINEEVDAGFETLGGNIAAEVERASAAETDIDNRLKTVEELAEISIDGGTIGIGTAEDFDDPTTEQRAKVPTIGALIDGADDEPTAGSDKLVKSGGVYKKIYDFTPYELSNFELGNINITNNGWTYSANTKRVRVKKGHEQYLHKGNVIGLSSYTDAHFYVGVKKDDGTYYTPARWNNRDYVCEYDGYYTLLLSNITEATQSSSDDLASLVGVDNLQERGLPEVLMDLDDVYFYYTDTVLPSDKISAGDVLFMKIVPKSGGTNIIFRDSNDSTILTINATADVQKGVFVEVPSGYDNFRVSGAGYGKLEIIKWNTFKRINLNYLYAKNIIDSNYASVALRDKDRLEVIGGSSVHVSNTTVINILKFDSSQWTSVSVPTGGNFTLSSQQCLVVRNSAFQVVSINAVQSTDIVLLISDNESNICGGWLYPVYVEKNVLGGLVSTTSAISRQTSDGITIVVNGAENGIAKDDVIYIEALTDNEELNFGVRAKNVGENTFDTISTNAKGSKYFLITASKNYEYIQAVNYVTAGVIGATLTLNIYRGVEASIKYMQHNESVMRADIDSNTADLATLVTPSYYDDYIDEKSVAIRNNILGINDVTDSFIFITDVHWGSNNKKSPLLIKELMKRGLTQKVIFGGDVCSATTPSGAEWLMPKEISEQMLLNGISREHGKIYCARGNHDFNGSKNNIVPGQPGSNNYAWSDKMAKDMIMSATDGDGAIVQNGSDDNGCYFYFDNPVKKLRYIFTFAVDGTDDVTLAQEQWLIGTALANIPSGYDIIFVNHDGIENASGLQCPTLYPDIPQIIHAVNEHTSGTTGVMGVSYDFTSLTCKVLLVISGHTHCDLQTYYGSIINVCSAGDIRSSFTGFEGDDTFTRTVGTVNEQLFNHVLIDRKKGDVYVTRIGGGHDRIFRAEVNTGSVNDTIELTSILDGTLTWGSYDADTNWHADGSPGTPVTPTNTKLSVSNGVVTCNASGQAVVYAKDASGNREFFNVIVS